MNEQSAAGSHWSEAFVLQLKEKEFRDAFVEDRIRTRIARLIRALREQPERGWSQAELGKLMGKPQSVVSRLEDPDYGKLTLQTLFQVAAAFDLPLLVDIPEWDKWLSQTADASPHALIRRSFDAEALVASARHANEVTSIHRTANAAMAAFAFMPYEQSQRGASAATASDALAGGAASHASRSNDNELGFRVAQ